MCVLLPYYFRDNHWKDIPFLRTLWTIVRLMKMVLMWGTFLTPSFDGRHLFLNRLIFLILHHLEVKMMVRFQVLIQSRVLLWILIHLNFRRWLLISLLTLGLKVHVILLRNPSLQVLLQQPLIFWMMMRVFYLDFLPHDHLLRLLISFIGRRLVQVLVFIKRNFLFFNVVQEICLHIIRGRARNEGFSGGFDLSGHQIRDRWFLSVSRNVWFQVELWLETFNRWPNTIGTWLILISKNCLIFSEFSQLLNLVLHFIIFQKLNHFWSFLESS